MDHELTAVFQMESTNAFEPKLSLELMRYKQYIYRSIFKYSILFKFSNKDYKFIFSRSPLRVTHCKSGFAGNENPSNRSINEDLNSCKWLINVGMNSTIENELGIGTTSYDLITQPNETLIELSSYSSGRWSMSEIAANNLTDPPIYHWSYARYCEYNKKVYDFDGDMITLKKDNNSFELFIYRYAKYEVKKPRHVTLINAKNSSISISCDDDRNDIIVSTKTGSNESSVLDKYIFRKHIDSLRLEFDSDFTVVDEPKIVTSTLASVDQQISFDENQKHDAVNPLVGVFLTIVTVVKSYFDLW
uniref:Uncharacterized protein n=1 Tax=Tetranychus urticae TaxID=32264 RepID=T1KC90_TETUR